MDPCGRKPSFIAFLRDWRVCRRIRSMLLSARSDWFASKQARGNSAADRVGLVLRPISERKKTSAIRTMAGSDELARTMNLRL